MCSLTMGEACVRGGRACPQTTSDAAVLQAPPPGGGVRGGRAGLPMMARVPDTVGLPRDRRSFLRCAAATGWRVMRCGRGCPAGLAGVWAQRGWCVAFSFSAATTAGGRRRRPARAAWAGAGGGLRCGRRIGVPPTRHPRLQRLANQRRETGWGTASTHGARQRERRAPRRALSPLPITHPSLRSAGG